MTMPYPWPAWQEFQEDRQIAENPTAGRVFSYLIRLPRIFSEPQRIKVGQLVRALGLSPRSGKSHNRVAAALALLVERGYLIEHGRVLHNVRVISVAVVRASLPQKGFDTAA